MNKCYECDEEALSTIVIRGPEAYEPASPERKFCSVGCFWKWIDRVIADRDKGGRLDRKINWD